MKDEYHITIEANSVEDAREKATSQLSKGLKISTELVVTAGIPIYISAIGQTVDETSAELQKRIPPGAEVIGREVLQQPGERSMAIAAFDDESAKQLAERAIQDYEDIKTIEIVEEGRKGFLGFGKKPGLYQVRVLQKSKVGMTYREKAKVDFTFAQKTLLEATSIEEIRVILESGSPVDVRNEGGYTPLMCAALRGDEAVVKLLLSKGADVNAATSWGETALTRAAQAGDTPMVELLLSCGADVNATEYDGYTALSRAAMNGHHIVVSILLSKGADVSIRTKHGHTALTLAEENRHIGAVMLLNK